MSDLFHSLEARFHREILRIEAQIRELQQERFALERQLRKLRQESVDVRDVTRKNSLNRVLIESRIIEALKQNRSLRNSELFKLAQKVNYELPSPTFRTYLHRLKLKGKIENDGHPGRWRLSQTGLSLSGGQSGLR